MMTVKQLVQSGFNAFGLRVSYNKFDLDYFFEAIKTRGFAPKHIVDVGANHADGHAPHSSIFLRLITR